MFTSCFITVYSNSQAVSDKSNVLSELYNVNKSSTKSVYMLPDNYAIAQWFNNMYICQSKEVHVAVGVCLHK